VEKVNNKANKSVSNVVNKIVHFLRIRMEKISRKESSFSGGDTGTA
jgi:hypothetical protein